MAARKSSTDVMNSLKEALDKFEEAEKALAIKQVDAYIFDLPFYHKPDLDELTKKRAEAVEVVEQLYHELAQYRHFIVDDVISADIVIKLKDSYNWDAERGRVTVADVVSRDDRDTILANLSDNQIDVTPESHIYPDYFVLERKIETDASSSSRRMMTNDKEKIEEEDEEDKDDFVYV